MSKRLSSFEESIKNSLEGAELPYESESWTALENRLNKKDSTNSRNRNIRWGIAAGLLLAASAVVTYNYSTSEKNSMPIVESSDNTEALKKAVDTKTANYDSRKDTKQSDSSNTDESSSELLDSTQSENTSTQLNPNTPSKQTGAPIESKTENSNITTTNKKDKQALSTKEVAFAPNIDEACAGAEITFDLTNTKIEGSYLWNFGDGNFSNEKNPVNVYTKPGIYSVTLAVTSDEDGVIKSNTKPVLITITPKPKADFDWEFVSGYNEVPTVKVINKSLNAIESNWTIDNKAVSNEINLIESFDKKGEYLIGLTVANEDGCTNTTYKSISIENDYNILAPKTFSPNNDGKDDTFIPRALRVLDKEFELSIYSEDQLVYRTTDPSKAWDGKLKDGSIAEKNQKFPWVVILYDTNGNKQYYSGIVTVVP